MAFLLTNSIETNNGITNINNNINIYSHVDMSKPIKTIPKNAIIGKINT